MCAAATRGDSPRRSRTGLAGAALTEPVSSTSALDSVPLLRRRLRDRVAQRDLLTRLVRWAASARQPSPGDTSMAANTNAGTKPPSLKQLRARGTKITTKLIAAVESTQGIAK